jgi:UDP-N-acetylmuramoylalanine--D-glutamate ligase
MAEYAQAKKNIFRNQTSADFAVVNAALALPDLKAQRITFSVEALPADYQLIEGWLVARGERVLEQAATRLIGPHNAENMLAALVVADLYDVPRDIACSALMAYHSLPHRLEKVGENSGVLYLNDSKATNIDALEKALRSMTRPVVLIAGGKDKGLDFSGLTPLVKEHARAVVLIGQMAGKLSSEWGAAVPCHRAASLAEAVRQCQTLAQGGDVVLLSPGCSSFDMFKDFEDRGNQFRELVRQLGAETASA